MAPERFHLVYFSPLAPALRFWKCGVISELALKGEMKISFNPKKMCIGYNDGEQMRQCSGNYEGEKQCPACARRDIARLYTRLDREGFESFYEKFRSQQFSVYLASFGHIVKCGVTRSARLNERVREQGADYFSEIARTNDADAAYSLESAIHQHFPVRGGLSCSLKLKLMRTESNPARLEACASRIKESGLLSGVEGAMETVKLEYPIPGSFSEAEEIDGRILGAKGQALFFEKERESYAVNMSKKVGSTFFIPE